MISNVTFPFSSGILVYSFCRRGPFALQVGDDTLDPSRFANGDLGPGLKELRQTPGFFVLELDLARAEGCGVQRSACRGEHDGQAPWQLAYHRFHKS